MYPTRLRKTSSPIEVDVKSEYMFVEAKEEIFAVVNSQNGKYFTT